MNNTSPKFDDFKNYELYSNEGDFCSNCGTELIIDINSDIPNNPKKTWTCPACGITESE